jgi:hypothetical protein
LEISRIEKEILPVHSPISITARRRGESASARARDDSSTDPERMPPEPPDPDTLPAPPQLEWEPLVPKGAELGGDVTAAIDVPPPEPETPIPPPPPPVIETPLPGGLDFSAMELAKPDVEIWRAESEMPQVPARRSEILDPAYVTGTEPVWLRVQFDPAAAGKQVRVRLHRGIKLNPPVSVLTIPANGEIVVLGELLPGFDRSHLIFYCNGIKTALPVKRASLATVILSEEETGGGH